MFRYSILPVHDTGPGSCDQWEKPQDKTVMQRQFNIFMQRTLFCPALHVKSFIFNERQILISADKKHWLKMAPLWHLGVTVTSVSSSFCHSVKNEQPHTRTVSPQWGLSADEVLLSSSPVPCLEMIVVRYLNLNILWTMRAITHFMIRSTSWVLAKGCRFLFFYFFYDGCRHKQQQHF